MARISRSRILSLVAIAALAQGCEESGDTAEVQAQLDAASPGDVVTAPAALYEGGLAVPPGVTLRPDGEGKIEITTGDECLPALRLTTAAGSGRTLVSGLQIRSRCGAAVLIKGDGEAEVDGLQMTVTVGYGLLAQGLSKLALSNVSATSELTEADLGAIEYDIVPDKHPMVALGLSKVADAQISGMQIHGFAGNGAVVSDSSGLWAGGAITDTIGVGLIIAGGSFRLEDVDVRGTDNCKALECPHNNEPYGVAALSGSFVESVGVTLVENGGPG